MKGALLYLLRPYMTPCFREAWLWSKRKAEVQDAGILISKPEEVVVVVILCNILSVSLLYGYGLAKALKTIITASVLLKSVEALFSTACVAQARKPKSGPPEACEASN